MGVASAHASRSNDARSSGVIGREFGNTASAVSSHVAGGVSDAGGDSRAARRNAARSVSNARTNTSGERPISAYSSRQPNSTASAKSASWSGAGVVAGDGAGGGLLSGDDMN